MPTDPHLQHVVNEIPAATPAVRWSIAVSDRHGDWIAAVNASESLRTASVGKILLLTELAAQLESGALHDATLIPRAAGPAAGGSGVLQYLTAESLPVSDLAVLVAAVSDNLATNLLLERVGLDRVADRAASLGLSATGLKDRVRDTRGPGDAQTLSTGSAGELCDLMTAAAADRLVSPAVSRRVREWLSLNADTTMVASAFDLDPLEHALADASVDGVMLFNKTGTDSGVRADVGWVIDSGGHRAAAYAAIADWDHGSHDHTAAVLAAMRRLGGALARYLAGSGPASANCGGDGPPNLDPKGPAR